MQLIGYLDSPFVRRVAITMRFLGIEFEHRELSIFRNYDEFRNIHPLVKVPTLVCDDGAILIDSSLIIDYLQTQVAGRSLMPRATEDFRTALEFTGVALVAMEKTAQLIYETTQRPEEKQHAPWIERLQQQLLGAVGLMESMVAENISADGGWLFGDQPGQADITVAVAWYFSQYRNRDLLAAGDYPALTAFSARAEALPEFLACPFGG